MESHRLALCPPGAGVAEGCWSVDPMRGVSPQLCPVMRGVASERLVEVPMRGVAAIIEEEDGVMAVLEDGMGVSSHRFRLREEVVVDALFVSSSHRDLLLGLLLAMDDSVSDTIARS